MIPQEESGIVKLVIISSSSWNRLDLSVSHPCTWNKKVFELLVTSMDRIYKSSLFYVLGDIKCLLNERLNHKKCKQID